MFASPYAVPYKCGVFCLSHHAICVSYSQPPHTAVCDRSPPINRLAIPCLSCAVTLFLAIPLCKMRLDSHLSLSEQQKCSALRSRCGLFPCVSLLRIRAFAHGARRFRLSSELVRLCGFLQPHPAHRLCLTWQGYQGSNLDIGSQSPLRFRYAISLQTPTFRRHLVSLV